MDFLRRRAEEDPELVLRILRTRIETGESMGIWGNSALFRTSGTGRSRCANIRIFC